jgi:hypothetical protein
MIKKLDNYITTIEIVSIISISLNPVKNIVNPAMIKMQIEFFYLVYYINIIVIDIISLSGLIHNIQYI